MDPQLLAALIEAGGTVLGAIILGAFIWAGISRGSRQRQRARHQSELFIAAVRDCADFVRETKDVTRALGTVVNDVMQRQQEGGQALLRRVEQEMSSFGRAGALVPPELLPLRNEVSKQVRALRSVALGAGRDLEQLNRANEATRSLNEATQAFVTAFEDWKNRHWSGREAKARPKRLKAADKPQARVGRRG